MKKLGNQVMIGRINNTCQFVNASFCTSAYVAFMMEIMKFLMVKKSQIFLFALLGLMSFSLCGFHGIVL